MTLSSTSFEDGGILPVQYTAASEKTVSPELSWAGEPASTVTFALIAHDMDADPLPTINHWHWGMVNIPASEHSLAQGQPDTPQLPDGAIQFLNAHNTIGWAGPAASGSTYHHYAFEIYALNAKLSLSPDSTQDDVYKAMKDHIVGEGIEVVRYHRTK